MEKAQSFEVTEYSTDGKPLDYKQSAIKEIVDNLKRRSPNLGVRVSFTGNLVKLSFDCYEMHLPTRLKEVESLASDVFKETLKNIKSEYKSKAGEKIDLKEKKELADYAVSKVSLNERYYYVSWRVYEIS